MALPPSTANWHWKNKNVTAWGKSWFERELTTITVDGENGEVVSISEVEEVDGDVELGQRKSKLITIYDCKVDLKWTGTASDGTEVNGRLKIPEVSHEITLDGLSDYVYDWSCSTKSSPAVDALFALAKSKLPVALETKFASFPSALIDTHGKDLQVTGSNEPSRTTTPAPVSGGASTSTSTGAAKAPVTKAEKPLNTASVTVDASFMASADDLFSLLTDENRIPSWTRAPAQSKPEPGQPFSLFGGGVQGTYVSLEPGNKIVQNWRLTSPSWPSDHNATMTIDFEQGSDSTKVTFNLGGVPSGMEDELKRNIEGYYIHGFKSIGYVRLFPSQPDYTPSHMASTTRSRTKQAANGKAAGATDESAPGSCTRALAVFVGIAVLAAAFAVPLLARTSSPRV